MIASSPGGRWRTNSNRAAVIKAMGDLERGLTLVRATVSRDVAELVAERAAQTAHVGPDPTYPKGRPHSVDTIAVQPLNQYASGVVGDYGIPWEERRGGEHAAISNAAQAVEPDALSRFEQLSLEAVRAVGGD